MPMLISTIADERRDTKALIARSSVLLVIMQTQMSVSTSQTR